MQANTCNLGYLNQIPYFLQKIASYIKNSFTNVFISYVDLLQSLHSVKSKLPFKYFKKPIPELRCCWIEAKQVWLEEVIQFWGNRCVGCVCVFIVSTVSFLSSILSLGFTTPIFFNLHLSTGKDNLFQNSMKMILNFNIVDFKRRLCKTWHRIFVHGKNMFSKKCRIIVQEFWTASKMLEILNDF